MLSIVALAGGSAHLHGCASPEQRRVDAAGQRYLDDTFTFNPIAGTAAGLHECDGRRLDLSAQTIAAHRQRMHEQRDALDALASTSLSQEQSLRVRELGAAVDAELFRIEVMRAYTHNPMTYASAVDVSIYAKRDFASLQERARRAASVLEGVPLVMAAARANLAPDLPRVYVETAIQMVEGQVAFLRNDLPKAFEGARGDELRQRLARAIDNAATTMADYGVYLRERRLPTATDDFAIGRDSFARMLSQQELIAQTPEEILEIGMAELARLTAMFEAAAREIDPSRPAAEVWAQVQRDHPAAATLIPETREHLEAIHAFFKQRDLVTYGTEERVIVEETPGFMRATTFASMDTPGAFERKATQSYYYITPPEPDWDAQRTEEWLTAFNYYTTDIVSVHEAYPGHFIQLRAASRLPLRGAWRMLQSYAFLEGWAHYCEEMAIEEGFPPPSLERDPTTAAKYRMAQASEALLRVCRLVAAIRMHCQGMTLDEATQFFVDHAYYAPAPARAEAQRGAYDPGYCLYTVGKLQLMTLRDDWRAQEGQAFSLKRFHDTVLRHGQAPVRLLRERMLRDPAIWDRTLTPRPVGELPQAGSVAAR
jgi:uncharacterized protein (DUF885 family)